MLSNNAEKSDPVPGIFCLHCICVYKWISGPTEISEFSGPGEIYA